jgi:hypothetical protein
LVTSAPSSLAFDPYKICLKSINMAIKLLQLNPYHVPQ